MWYSRFFVLTLLIILLTRMENVCGGISSFMTNFIANNSLSDQYCPLQVRFSNAKSGALMRFTYFLTDFPSFLRQLCTWVFILAIPVTLSTALSLATIAMIFQGFLSSCHWFPH